MSTIPWVFDPEETPIYAALFEEVVLQNCPACIFMFQGWGGPGCCEVCDRYRVAHTCDDSDA